MELLGLVKPGEIHPCSSQMIHSKPYRVLTPRLFQGDENLSISQEKPHQIVELSEYHKCTDESPS